MSNGHSFEAPINILNEQESEEPQPENFRDKLSTPKFQDKNFFSFKGPTTILQNESKASGNELEEEKGHLLMMAMPPRESIEEDSPCVYGDAPDKEIASDQDL